MTTRSRRPTKKPRREPHAAASEFDDPDLWPDIFADEDSNSNDDFDNNTATESGDVIDKEEEEEDIENNNKYTTDATLHIAASGRNYIEKTTVDTVLDANFDGDYNHHEEHPGVPVAFSSLPQSCSTTIFNYAAVTPEDVMQMSLISKQSRSDCLHESIVQKIVPTIYLSSGRAQQCEEAMTTTATQRRSSCRANESKSEREWYALLEMITRTMLQKLQNRQFVMGQDKAQSHYERMELTSLEEFGCLKLSEAVTITNDLSFEGVVSLDMSSPSAVNPQVIGFVHSHEYISFPAAILSMLPCLLEINLTNTIWEDSHLANSFPCSNCFEKLTWNGRRQGYLAHKPNIPNIKNIKEIYMDDYLFEEPHYTQHTYDDISILWNMEKVSKKRLTIFSNLRSAKKLERLSIRNVRYQKEKRSNNTRLFPQRALIKFVQNTLPPNVRWLRSDLSTANIASLQLNYPQIVFVQN